MSNAVLLTPPVMQFFDNNGNPLAGGLLFTYAAGTTTNKATYTDDSAGTQLPNPIVLDAAGRAVIWINGAYKFVLEDSLGNVIRTVDNVTAFTTTAASSSSYSQSFSGNGVTTVFTLSQNLGTDENAVMIFENSGIPPCVANGTFASDTVWTKDSGWTISGGVATAAGAISTAISQNAILTLIPGQAYAVTYTVTESAGSLTPSVGGQDGTARSSAGTYREIIVCGSTQVIAFRGASFTGTLASVSVTLADPAGFEIQNPANFTLNGTSLTFATPPASGTNNILVFAPSLLVGATSAFAAAADASATAAANNAAAAAASAATALAAAYSGTSTTSNAIATGSVSFTTQANKNFATGNFLLISSNATPANYFHGQVTSYNIATGALVFNSIDTGGSGTAADWNIAVSGTRGAAGATGPAGATSALGRIGVLVGANFNTTADQAITMTIPAGFATYVIDKITISGASNTSTTARGGIYGGTSKSGATIVASTQAYTLGASAVFPLTLSSANQIFNNATIYFSLTTAEGSALTGQINVYGTFI